MTKAEFRQWLNQQFPAQSDLDKNTREHKGERGQYGRTKRAYGDYLWHQDRVMFDVEYSDLGVAGLPADVDAATLYRRKS